MTIEQKVNVLATMTTRYDGKHFTERFTWETLKELESLGLIEITRPVHSTGVEYSEEYYSVEVTEAGQNLVDVYPEFHPVTA